MRPLVGVGAVVISGNCLALFLVMAHGPLPGGTLIMVRVLLTVHRESFMKKLV
jgi:hypothetical protein